MNSKTEYLKPYISRKCRITQSVQHEHMFIVNFSDGTFYTVYNIAENVLLLHPPDKDQRFLPDEKFSFTHTSSYKPSKGFEHRRFQLELKQHKNGAN